MEFGVGKTGRIDIVQNIGTVLVVVAVRNLATDFMQLRRPVELALEAFGFGSRQAGAGHHEKVARHPADPLGLSGIGLEFPCDTLYGRGAQVGQFLLPVQQVIQHAVPQGTLGCLHLRDPHKLENSPQHADAAANHRPPVVFHAVEFQALGALGLEQAVQHPVKAFARDHPVRPACRRQNVTDRTDGA